MRRRIHEFAKLALALAVMPAYAAAESGVTDPYFHFQWSLENTGQDFEGGPGLPGADVDALRAWQVHAGSSSVLVAIVGSGVNPHLEFADRLLTGRATIGDLYNTFDSCQLGTHAAGIVAAKRNNGAGIAGIAGDVLLLPVRTQEACAGTPVVEVRRATAEGIVWAADQGADIILVLLAFSDGNQALADAVSYAAAQGALLVGPSGNGGNVDEVGFPAAYDECVAVSATTAMDEAWPDSNFGVELDVSAPGADILSTWADSNYEYRSSTASAAALVAGTAALMLSYAPHLTPAQIRQYIVDSADGLGQVGWPAPYDVGRLNAGAALEMTAVVSPPALRFEHVEPTPETFIPGEPTEVSLRVVGVAEEIQDGSAVVRYREKALRRAMPTQFQERAGTALGDGLYSFALPALPCQATMEYWMAAVGTGGTEVSDPLNAPTTVYAATATLEAIAFEDDFEGDGGWSTESEGDDTTGAWTRVEPVGTSAQPGFDFSPGAAGYCYVTGQHLAGPGDGSNDVDGGPVRLISPSIALDAPDAEVSYACWFHSTDGEPDRLTVEVTYDDGTAWILAEEIPATEGWEVHGFRLSELPGAIGNQFRVRFSTSDLPGLGDSLTEAAVDEVRVRAIQCVPAEGDFDGNGRVELDDYRNFASCLVELPAEGAGLGVGCGVFDLNGTGRVDLGDFQRFQNVFGG